MLMYGSSEIANMLINQNINDLIIYNLSSLNEVFPRLYLLPPNLLGNSYDYQFDVNYMNWIINNDAIFVEFMKIIYPLYSGMNVYLVISPDDWSENIVDSLMKLIQERYGVVGVKVNSFDDYIYANDADFSVNGLLNVIIDNERNSILTYTKKEDDYNESGQM